MRAGVEVGGTFTDLIAVQDGQIRTAKVPSTPDAPERGAFDALAAWGGALDALDELVHGSTVATNAVLERRGARVCLLVTRGMRDVLHLQRHHRRRIYDLHYRKPQPLVARRDTFEVRERMAADGSVVEALDEAHAAELIRRCLVGGGYDGLAIALLNSYANAAHEQRLAELAVTLGWRGPITCSSEVNPVFREYERFSTTAMSAYVQPVVASYLQRFEARLAEAGFGGHFSVMQSNGGRLPATAMGRNAITALFSGPAAGVVGAIHQCARSGYHDLITFDMGGTSSDVCLVENGAPQLVSETEVDGLPVRTPVLDIVTVGAGGGSVVWVDDGGLLRVGPRSSGAMPGPAAYGRGGGQPTVTDAHVVRGSIRPEAFLGGRMPLDAAAARAVLAPLAGQLGLSLEEAADAAIRVAESNIVRAIQRVSTERGKDPRRHALVPYGGAGPMQAVRVAVELGIDRVIVPPHAGVLSALGLLAADHVHHATRTRRLAVEDGTMHELASLAADLRAQVARLFDALGLGQQVRYSYSLDMRYVTQAFEIPVSLDETLALAPVAADLAARFHAAHEQVFEFAAEGAMACEVVSVRVGGAVAPASLPAPVPARPVQTAAERRRVYEGGAAQLVEFIARDALPGPQDSARAGPLVVEDETSTIYVPCGWQAGHDAAMNLIIERIEEGMPGVAGAHR